jgi:hypothetical protein
MGGTSRVIKLATEKANWFIHHRSSTYHSGYFLAKGLLALALYLGIAWFVLLPQAFWSPDEGAKLLQVQNLRLQNGRLVYGIEYTGRELDPDLQFASGGLLFAHQNLLYLERFPLFPLLTLPFFSWFGFQGLYLIPALGGAVIGILTLHLLPGPDRRLAMWVLIAFGSPVLIYAVMFWEHTLVTGMGLGALWLGFQIGPAGWPAPPRQIVGWVIIGLILGLSVYIRTETILFAIAWLGAYMLLAPQGRWGVTWAGISLGVMLVLYVPLHRAMFGETEKILHSSFLYGFHPLSYLNRAGWQVIPDFLIGAAEDEAIAPGWLGWVWAISALVALGCSFFTNSRLARTVMLLALGLTAAVGAIFLFTGTLYRSAHGLLFSTPWAALGLCRAREVWRQGDWRMRVMVLSTLFGLVGYLVLLVIIRAPSFGPHGALEWGARYVLTFYPLLAIMAAWKLRPKWRDLSSLVIVGALLFLGIGFQIRGIWTIRRDKQINFALNQMMAATPDSYIISDLWWLPLNAAPLYKEKTIFFAPPEKMAAWVDRAAAAKIRQFSLVTLNPSLLEQTSQSLALNKLIPLDVYHVGNLLIFHVGLENQ